VDIGNGARKRRKLLKIETFKKEANEIELMALKIERLQKKSINL